MNRTPDAIYEQYKIFTVAIPEHDSWIATSEVEKHSADGIETFQQFGGPCVGRTSEEARERVIADSKHKIDDILARPVSGV